jgi:YHS domain-containing protein
MGKEIDPVCGMEVDSEKTPYKSIYKGKIYYFCSPHCRRAFEKDPGHYLEHGTAGMSQD